MANRRRQNIDSAGRGGGVAHQIEQRGDRLDLGAAQVQWIEVEAKLWQQHQTAGGDDAGRQQHRAATRGKEAIKPRQRRVANGGGLTARTQHRKQRRQ